MYRPFLPYMTGLSSNELPNHGKQQHVNRPRVKERQTRLSNVAPMDSATQVAGNLRPNSFTFELYVRILGGRNSFTEGMFGLTSDVLCI